MHPPNLTLTMSISTANPPITLPHEIWLNIFDQATLIPNAFSPHAPDLFSYPGPWPQDRIQEALRTSLCTKRRIVLVCKSWNALATRILYRSVFISRPRSLELVLRSLTRRGGWGGGSWSCDADKEDEDLEGKSVSAFASERSKGRWTVRLDIALKHNTTFPLFDFKALLALLPNLQIIVARGHLNIFNEAFFLDVLADQPLYSLNVLDLHAIDRSGISGRLDGLRGFPLRVLRIRPPRLSLWLKHPIVLSELEFLDAPPQLLRSVFAGETPVGCSLKCLSLEDDYDAVWKVVKGDLSSVGRQLRSIEIDDGCLVDAEASLHLSKPALNTLFHSISQSCPNLTSLVIKLRDIESISPPNISSLPPIQKLGLRFCGKDINSKKWFKRLCEILARLVLVTPSLKVIRIIGRPSLEALRRHHAGSFCVVRRWSRRLLVEFGVRFEDWTGQVFHDVRMDLDGENYPSSSATLSLENQLDPGSG